MHCTLNDVFVFTAAYTLKIHWNERILRESTLTTWPMELFFFYFLDKSMAALQIATNTTLTTTSTTEPRHSARKQFGRFGSPFALGFAVLCIVSRSVRSPHPKPGGFTNTCGVQTDTHRYSLTCVWRPLMCKCHPTPSRIIKSYKDG